MNEATVFVLEANQMDTLLEVLRARGLQTIGPTVRDGAIVYDEIGAAADLPVGFGDEQAPG